MSVSLDGEEGPRSPAAEAQGLTCLHSLLPLKSQSRLGNAKNPLCSWNIPRVETFLPAALQKHERDLLRSPRGFLLPSTAAKLTDEWKR